MDYTRQKQSKVIHLVRENTLKVIVSRHRVRLSGGVAHTFTEVPILKIHLPASNLIGEIKKIEKAKARWRKRLSAFAFLEVSYESFVSDKKDETHRVLSFLGVDGSYELTSPLKRINPDRLDQVIENYDEVRDILRNTAFAKFLQ
jgi:LPS sulfotransferase NodH